MDALDLGGVIWTALKEAGLDVVTAGYRDRPEVRALVVRQVEGPSLLVVVSEMREEVTACSGDRRSDG